MNHGEEVRWMLTALWNGYLMLLHATAFLAGTWLLLVAVQRFGAAARARVHAFGLLGMLAVTGLCWLPIGWWAWILPAPITEPMVRIGAASLVTRLGMPSVVAGLLAAAWIMYVIGVALALSRVIAGYCLIRRASHDARAVASPEWQVILREACVTMDTGQTVELRYSSTVTTAVTWGMLDPVILLPDDADSWPLEHRRLVLLHELAHIRRADWLVRLLARGAVAVYWFHPGAWVSMRALVAAQEEACDALVLSSGARRSAYASCLLHSMEWARGRTSLAGSALAPGMASLPHVHRRVRQVLEAPLHVRWSGPAQLCCGALLAAWILVAGSIRLAPGREVMWQVLDSRDWTRRAYAAAFLSHSRNPQIQARLRARTAGEPSQIVRRLALGARR